MHAYTQTCLATKIHTYTFIAVCLHTNTFTAYNINKMSAFNIHIYI